MSRAQPLRRSAASARRALLRFEILERRDVLSTITIQTGQTVRTLNDDIFGVNLTNADEVMTSPSSDDATATADPQSVSLLSAAGFHMVRLGSGGSTDEWHFNQEVSPLGLTSGAGALANAAAAIGADALVTVNYGTGTPQEAAAYLAYLDGDPTNTYAIGTDANGTNWGTVGYWATLRSENALATDDGLNMLRAGHPASFNFHYFEVGNEAYYGEWLPQPSGAFYNNSDPSDYARFATTFAGLASHIYSSAKIGVDFGDPGSSGYLQSSWNIPLLQDCKADGFTPGFVDDHLYLEDTTPGDGSTTPPLTDSQLLTQTVSSSSSTDDGVIPINWATRAADDRSVLNTYLGSAASGVQILAGEFNVDVNYDSFKQSTSLVEGLLVADAIGSIMQTEYQSLTFWDFRNYYNAPAQSPPSGYSFYGWRTGSDQGMVGSGYPDTPPSTGPDIAYPSYYAEELTSKLGTTGDSVVSATSSSSLTSAYAVKQQNGDVAILLINKSPSVVDTASITLPGYLPETTANLWQYGETEDNAQKNSSNGAASLTHTTPTLNVSGNQFSMSLPVYSMSLLILTPTVSLAYANTAWSSLAYGTQIADADPTVAGNQPATVGVNAFGTLQAAAQNVIAGGTITVFPGTYQGVTLTQGTTLNVPTGTVIVAGVLGGTALLKTGIGTLTLQGANTYTGGTSIEAGTITIAADTALGAATGAVTGSASAALDITASMTTSRTFTLGTGSLAVSSGAILTLSNATVSGGTLSGPGMMITTVTGTTAFNGSQSAASLAIQSLGADSFTSFTNGGALTTASGKTVAVAGFTNDGQATIAGTFTNSGSSGLQFASGSSTTIDAGATVNLGTVDASIAGTVTNLGSFGSSANIDVGSGGRLQGVGTFGSVLTSSGGVFDPGPGSAITNQFNVNGGGRFEFDVANASGSAGTLSGWTRVLVEPTVFNASSASLAITASAASKFTLLLTSRANDGTGTTTGPAANFDPSLEYAWKFADAASASISGSFNAADFSIDTSAFANSFNGGFSVQLPSGSNSLYVVYTPIDGPPVPVVTGVLVNGGAAQRSRLTSITVSFQNPIDASTLTAPGAITLTSTGNYAGGPTGTVVKTGATGANGLINVSPASGLVTNVTLTFANADGSSTSAGVEYGSLADGEWQLAIPSIGYASAANDPNLHRLFGDINGDSTVNAGIDQGAFVSAFGLSYDPNNLNNGYNAAFDFNGDGTISAGVDQGAFVNRFGLTLP